MKCPEVVEWMHRYLDYDLSEEETVQLYEHLKHCPECTETFRMLKSLSRDLEDLPKVTPKFSIVDAIMPQLDAIDQARQEKSASREEAPAEMVPVPARQVRNSKFRNSVAGRTAIGAVAAMVILGVAIYSYPQKHLSTAEEPAFKASEQKTAGSAATSADSSQGSGGERQDLEPKREMLYSAEPGNTPAEDDAAASAGGASELKSADTSSSDRAEKEQPVQSEAPSDKVNPEASRSADAKTDAKTDAKAPDESVSASQKGAPAEKPKEKQDPAQKPADDTANLDKATAAGNTGGDGGASQDGAQGQANETGDPAQEKSLADEKVSMGISALKTPAAQINSPDGKYVASVEDNKLVIYAVSDQESQKKAVKTIDLQGSWVSGVWSADSTVFTYQTADDQGTATSKTYRVEDSAASNP
ncbi:zf-HC2 domain-containing protein [Paenibacillus sp. VCA1]|uniref:zf-HC2 domain-containing protein n=1 Tax=Paenibacillus sp. VCA1 TaxID=3039148 RepID=UPI002870CAC7|nr:zf-HC2 domain-containing protein [Paenibacillus sp. VCA1]MDR9853091.1 zf-HC2 domain-containing protein [Paenibacillus sp. VCA1]